MLHSMKKKIIQSLEVKRRRRPFSQKIIVMKNHSKIKILWKNSNKTYFFLILLFQSNAFKSFLFFKKVRKPTISKPTFCWYIFVCYLNSRSRSQRYRISQWKSRILTKLGPDGLYITQSHHNTNWAPNGTPGGHQGALIFLLYENWRV